MQDDDQGLVISLRLIPNPKLTQVILSYGADVKVLKPAVLKEQIEAIWKRCG